MGAALASEVRSGGRTVALTESILLPPAEGRGGLEIRIPTLGAFALNKANTFHLRGGAHAELKAGKDLLHLRDVMAAGARPAAVLEEDLDAIAAAPGNRGTIKRATYHLRRVAPRYHRSTAEILSERDGVEVVAARAEVEGYLTDVAEILGRRAGE